MEDAGSPIESHDGGLRVSVEDQAQRLRNRERVGNSLGVHIRNSADVKRGSLFGVEECFHGGKLGRLIPGNLFRREITAERLQERRDAADQERQTERMPMKIVAGAPKNKEGMDPGDKETGGGE